MAEYWLYIPAGLLVGTLVGLTGVGGGSLMTPILVLAFGQAPSVAVGTDLVFAATTKLAATASFGYSRRVDWRIVGQLALGILADPAACPDATVLALGIDRCFDALVAAAHAEPRAARQRPA